MQKLDQLNDLFIRHVQESIEMSMRGLENEFPVISTALTKSGVASRKQLDLLEEQGHIKSITIEVPSVLVPSKTVPEKAYYTERQIPRLVAERSPSN